MKLLFAVISFLFLYENCYSVGSLEPPISVKIVILGSSTAVGVGASTKEKSWAGLLSNYCSSFNDQNTQISVINLAISGYTSYQVLPSDFIPLTNRPLSDSLHNISAALKFRPEGIIVNLPTNDIAMGYDPSEQLKNFYILDSIAKANNVKIWFTTTQPRNLSDYGRNKLICLKDSILAKFSGHAIDFWTGLASSSGSILPLFDFDGIHLNDNGHALLFSRIIEKKILDSLNVVTLTSEKDKFTFPKTRYFLNDCYPNPFNPSTTIKFQIPQKSKVKLAIFDIFGKMVAELVNMEYEAGKYEINFNGSNLCSGMYFYRFQADNFIETKKMMLIK